MKKQTSSTSFVNLHSPTRNELTEFLENVSSFNRNRSPKRTVGLNRQTGEILSLEDFLLTNTVEGRLHGKVMNPNETRCLLPPYVDSKAKSLEERSILKLAKYKCNIMLRMEGKNPKKWFTYIKLVT